MHIKKSLSFIFTAFVTAQITGCFESSEAHDAVQSVKQETLLPEVSIDDRVSTAYVGAKNEEAPIPPQCYTKTEGQFNPCYTCHQNYDRSETAAYRFNRRDDGDNQGFYTFSEVGEKNYWNNLFIDKSHWTAKISDEQIIQYIDQDNYSELANKLSNENWQGFIPDLNNYHQGPAAFDNQGLAKDGSYWVAFNYKPFPGTFWPTNGSTDDVLIRLPKRFREHNGNFKRELYYANLALVEMTIKDLESIDIFPLNEQLLETDVDGNGILETSATMMTRRSHYLGDAKSEIVAPQQYPQGTEIMHSVRYVGIDSNDQISVSNRMKELRYMKKTKVLSEAQIDNQYRRERKEKLDEQLPHYTYLHDKGFNNKFGWQTSAFIEDYNGDLRPQTYEETFACLGCHAAIGTTIDQTFSFPRKVTGTNGWGYIDLKGMQDAPNVTTKTPNKQPIGEIMQYLISNGGGNEFRTNPEMVQKWYHNDGSLDQEKVKAADVYQLITPSKKRALELNKAYAYIVRHQSFVYGRDANTEPATNVYQTIDESNPPLHAKHRVDNWDIRLDWSQVEHLFDRE